MRKIKFLWPLVLPCGLIIVSCKQSDSLPTPSHSLKLEWEGSNTLSETNLSVKLEAVLDFEDNATAVVVWNLSSSLPMGVTKHISGNFITFTMSLENNITAKNIQIEAVHGKLKKTTALSIEKYEKPVTYDYRVFLNYSEITLTQDNTASKNNPKKVTATIKNQQGTTFSDKHVTWSGIDVLPNWINVDTSVDNQISFTIQDNVETSDNVYTISATYSETNKTIINSSFALKTENYEVWQNNWIPKSSFDIVGNTLKGFRSGVNLSQYDTLHIPKGIVHISNNAFREGESITSKIPSNITNFDFGASQVETIGSYAFIDAPFTNVLTLFDTIKTISYSAFIGSKISGIDLSRCHLLTTLQRETFADCDQVQTIIFNDNLRVISNPAGAGLGVFQGLKNFNGTLHLPSKLETIGAAAFSDLGIYSSTKVTLEWDQCTELKEIGSNSLSYIKFVPNTQLVIPDKVTTLGKQMFDGAKGITRIEIPTSVIQIGCNSFSMAMNNPSADILSIVKIKRTASVYQYLVPRPTSNWGTNPFEYWLRGTNIEPDYANPNPQPGAQLLVPQALWQTYCDTFPQTMRSAIIGY